MGATLVRRTPGEPSDATASARDVLKELEFLRHRIGALARGRYPDEQEDVASDAWIRLDRALRREGARNEEAMMTSIAWRAWIDFCRKKMTACGALGHPVPLDEVEVKAATVEHGVDPEALATWRFAVLEWFARHQPRCMEPAHQQFAGRSWTEAAEELREQPNSLAKRWQRCKDAFVSAIRKDRGELRGILDYFEEAVT